ncbi:MAG: hypothetical protein HOV94_44110 [Saccharothrix sp.]|nr:hypothetical protein [Saccharothrix sp.]
MIDNAGGSVPRPDQPFGGRRVGVDPAAPAVRRTRARASSAVDVGNGVLSTPARPGRALRLVIRVGQVGEPGNSGSTCGSSRALSSTTSARVPAGRCR